MKRAWRSRLPERRGGPTHAAGPAFALLGFALACGYLPLPGGKLDGTVKPVPDDWSFLADTSIVQIETRPSDPYSVNVWAVGMGPAVYLHAGTHRTAWVEHLEADPRLRLRVGADLYELRAVRVTSQEEFDRFADAYEGKYGVRPRHEKVEEVYLLRLEPRGPARLGRDPDGVPGRAGQAPARRSGRGSLASQGMLAVTQWRIASS